jgi:hypothetical protein
MRGRREWQSDVAGRDGPRDPRACGPAGAAPQGRWNGSSLHRHPAAHPRSPADDDSRVLQALLCGIRTVQLLLHRRLHLRTRRVGDGITLPDGRSFVVFRESTCDGDRAPGEATLVVWFHLRGIPAGSRVRRFLFERLCLANTILFAGFDGYRVKLWMVDPETADYAGLYAWRGAEEADVYARYITGVLRPLSLPASVGYQVLPGTTLEDYLVSGDPRGQW